MQSLYLFIYFINPLFIWLGENCLVGNKERFLLTVRKTYPQTSLVFCYMNVKFIFHRIQIETAEELSQVRVEEIRIAIS